MKAGCAFSRDAKSGSANRVKRGDRHEDDIGAAAESCRDGQALQVPVSFKIASGIKA